MPRVPHHRLESANQDDTDDLDGVAIRATQAKLIRDAFYAWRAANRVSFLVWSASWLGRFLRHIIVDWQLDGMLGVLGSRTNSRLSDYFPLFPG